MREVNICVDLWVEVTRKVEEYPPQESMIGSHESFEDCFLQMKARLRVCQKSRKIGKGDMTGTWMVKVVETGLWKRLEVEYWCEVDVTLSRKEVESYEG